MAERRVVFRKSARLAFSKARAVTACSDDLAERAHAIGAPSRPTTVPYGVDCHRFGPSADDPRMLKSLRERFGWSPEESFVLAVGRLVHKKGFEYLIDALSILSGRSGRRVRGSGADFTRPRLVIAGSGDLDSWLRERAEAQSVGDRLQLIGNVEREELPTLFRLATVVAVPSVIDAAGNVDGLPNVLLEAMASGAPIVASRVAGIPQAIVDGSSGLLVPEKDPPALADAIGSLIADADERRRLGDSARARAQDSFSWAQVGERFENLLLAVARTSGTPA